MARGLNKVLLIGNLGRDPEMKYTPSGMPVTTFSVAVSRSWRTPEGENREETEWFRVVAWQKLAETCNEYLRKGSKVYIEGRLQTRKWQDQQGQDRYTTEIIENEMQMLDSRGPGASDTQSSSFQAMPAAQESMPLSQVGSSEFNDDVPF